MGGWAIGVNGKGWEKVRYDWYTSIMRHFFITGRDARFSKLRSDASCGCGSGTIGPFITIIAVFFLRSVRSVTRTIVIKTSLLVDNRERQD